MFRSLGGGKLGGRFDCSYHAIISSDNATFKNSEQAVEGTDLIECFTT